MPKEDGALLRAHTLTRYLVGNVDLGADDLDRLATLGDYARHQLEDAGRDVEELYRIRGWVTSQDKQTPPQQLEQSIDQSAEQPAKGHQEESGDQLIAREIQEAAEWLQRRKLHRTPEEMKARVFEAAERLGHAQAVARRKGVHGETLRELRRAGRAFANALDKCMGPRIRDLIEKRRTIRDAEIRGETVEQLTPDEQKDLGEALSRLADYFNAVAVKEALSVRDPNVLDRVLLWSQRNPIGKAVRRGLTLVGLSAATVGALIMTGPPGWAGAFLFASTLAGTGAGLRLLGESAKRRVTYMGANVKRDIIERNLLEMDAIESLREGMVAPEGVLYNDPESLARFDWRDLIRARVEYVSDEMLTKSERFIRAMRNGGLTSLLFGMAGTGVAGAEVALDQLGRAAKYFVVDIAGEYAPANITIGSSMVALGATVLEKLIDATVGNKIRGDRITLHFERYLASLAGYRPKYGVSADNRPFIGFDRPGRIDDYWIANSRRKRAEARRRREAAEAGGKLVTVDSFLDFVRQDADAFYKLRESLSSDSRRGGVLYRDFIRSLISGTALLPNEDERISRARAANIMDDLTKRVDAVIDEEYARRRQALIEQRAAQRREKVARRRERIAQEYELRKAAWQSRNATRGGYAIQTRLY